MFGEGREDGRRWKLNHVDREKERYYILYTCEGMEFIGISAKCIWIERRKRWRV